MLFDPSEIRTGHLNSIDIVLRDPWTPADNGERRTTVAHCTWRTIILFVRFSIFSVCVLRKYRQFSLVLVEVGAVYTLVSQGSCVVDRQAEC